VHPEIISAYEAGDLVLSIRGQDADRDTGLDAAESAVLRFLRSRRK
jgi:hypothetical protein